MKSTSAFKTWWTKLCAPQLEEAGLPRALHEREKAAGAFEAAKVQGTASQATCSGVLRWRLTLDLVNERVIKSCWRSRYMYMCMHMHMCMSKHVKEKQNAAAAGTVQAKSVQTLVPASPGDARGPATWPASNRARRAPPRAQLTGSIERPRRAPPRARVRVDTGSRDK